MDGGAEQAHASCYGVNLAFAGFGGGGILLALAQPLTYAYMGMYCFGHGAGEHDIGRF
jgi:hypothetical protein